MLTRQLMLFKIIVALFGLLSCAPKISYSLVTKDNSNIKKIYFEQDKDVIELNSFGQHGTFFLHHDFSFRKRLVVNLKEARVMYKGYGMHLNFIGNDLEKDTLHLDGDENLLTVFSIPFKVQIGDTITVKFDNFLSDEKGKSYDLGSIHFIATEIRRRK